MYATHCRRGNSEISLLTSQNNSSAQLLFKGSRLVDVFPRESGPVGVWCVGRRLLVNGPAIVEVLVLVGR